MPELEIIAVPYHLGRLKTKKGAGPLALIEEMRGAPEIYPGVAEYTVVEAETNGLDEVSALVEVNRRVTEAVIQAVANGRLAFVLGGDCNHLNGLLAGLDEPGQGLIWYDAHGDFNTPETSPSGYLEGMPLAMATGRCFGQLFEAGPGESIDPRRAALIGWRNLDPPEIRVLEEFPMVSLPAAEYDPFTFEAAFARCLDRLADRTDRMVVHIDLDILDPAHAPETALPEPNGLSPNQLLWSIEAVAERFRITGLALAGYWPDKDQTGQTRRTCLRLIGEILEVFR